MDHPTVKTVHCSGTPYEIGLQHGQTAADEVHNNITTYTAFFWETAQISWAAARARAVAQFVPTLRARYPEILEEMEGIAMGAGGDLSRDDILTLNVRSEIALTNYSDGCTSISQQAGFGQVFLAQNWDWLVELHRGMIFLDIKPKDSDIRLKFLGEGGIVGKIGMNSAGLGMCMNAIRSGAFNASYLPVHVMSRRILQYARTVDNAVEIINSFGVASTINYMLADSGGENIDVEGSPLGNTMIKPNKGIVFHTNHLYGADRPSGLIDHPAENSFSRLARIRELTEKDKEPPCFDSLRKRLSDEEGTPFSICRDRPLEAVGMEKMTTLACIIMEVKSRTGQVLIGRPCDSLPVVHWSF
jgi:isopenicillin-N N-acyltransferase like protein